MNGSQRGKRERKACQTLPQSSTLLAHALQSLMLKYPPACCNSERNQHMVRKTGLICCALLAIAFLAAGCGNAQKEATDAAISAAQAAINAAQTEAAKYVPDQLQAAQTTLQTAKDALAKGDYPAALSAAQDAANKAKDLAAAAAAKKAEWTQQWSDLSATLPKSLDQVKDKLNAYSHGAHMPAGLDKSKLADAKAQYEQLKQTWTDASASFTQGNLSDAMSKVPGIQAALAKLKDLLGIKS
jgi:DNA repair exonuclease SbcCD ATPase subunit